MADPSRRPDGTLKPGHKVGKGRPLGSKNKVPSDLRGLVIDTDAKLGKDGRGRDGLEGYFRSLAQTRPDLFAGFISKIMPTKPAEAEATFTAGIEQMTFLAVPSAHYFMPDVAETGQVDPWVYSSEEVEALQQIRRVARERAEAEAR